MANTQFKIEAMRIKQAAEDIRDKMVDMTVAAATDKIDVVAEKVQAIVDFGIVEESIKDGETYTIEKGWYEGGTITAHAGGGETKLQAKTATPTEEQQTVGPDTGFYGLSQVTVDAIPAKYKDTTPVTAEAADVLAGEKIVTADGVVTGTMPINAAESVTLTKDSTSYTIPAGHHSGNGTVGIVVENKTVTPAPAGFDVAPTEGKVLGVVTVEAIPAIYGDATNADAVAADIATGVKAVVNVNGVGTLVSGAMPVNGDVGATINLLEQEFPVNIPAGKCDASTVTISGELLALLQSI